MTDVKIIDFDKLFKQYFKKWFSSNSSKYSADQMENMMPSIYNEWLKRKDENLNCSPSDYYRQYDCESLVTALDKFLEKKQPICDILCDAIVEKNDDIPVFEALKKATNEEKQSVLIEILKELNSEKPIALYCYWVKTGDCSEEIRECSAEALRDFADIAKDKLLENVEKDDEETKLLVADILAGCAGDERVYNLLVNILRTSDDISLAAAYLEKFGDERAIGLLTEYIEREDINYVEFIELRNAIEALGGEVNVKRDFSEDNYYKLIKNSAVKEEETKTEE